MVNSLDKKMTALIVKLKPVILSFCIGVAAIYRFSKENIY